MNFLVDECLHVSLVDVLHAAGHLARHVARCGMQGYADHSILKAALEEDLVLVTNNAVDFRRLHGREELHPGLVIIVPNVPPEMQCRLLKAVLNHLAERTDLINTVVEIDVDDGNGALVREYQLP